MFRNFPSAEVFPEFVASNLAEEKGAGRGIDCHAGYNEEHGWKDPGTGLQQTISHFKTAILA
jgi:hypothetical protein